MKQVSATDTQIAAAVVEYLRTQDMGEYADAVAKQSRENDRLRAALADIGARAHVAIEDRNGAGVTLGVIRAKVAEAGVTWR